MGQSNTSFTFQKSKRLYRFVWQNTAKHQIIVCSLAILTLPLALAPVEIQRRIIDDAVATEDVSLLVWLAGIYAAAIVFQQVAKYTYNYRIGCLSEALVRDMRTQLFGALGKDKKPEKDVGAVVSMVSSEVEPIGEFAGNSYAQLITEGGVFIVIAVYMLATEFWLAAVAMLAFIPQVIATPILQNKINRLSARRLTTVRSVGNEAIAMSKGDDRFQSGTEKITQIFLNRVSIFQIKFALKAMLNFFDHFADLVVLSIGGYMVVTGETNIGVVVAFLSGLGRLRSPWRELIVYFRRVAETQLRYELLEEKLNLKEKHSATSRRNVMPVITSSNTMGINNMRPIWSFHTQPLHAT